MTIGLAFWIVFGVWVIFNAGTQWGGPQWASYSWGGTLIVAILLAFLGWHDFGPPLHQ